MDDLNQMMKKIQEDMEAEFMVNELAKLDLKLEDLTSDDITAEQREAIMRI